MTKFDKLKALLGNTTDTEESPYQTYDNMVKQVYDDILKNKADLFVKNINNPQIPIEPGSQSKSSELEKSIPDVLDENLNIYQTQKDYIKKANPKIGRDIYDIDRALIADQISKNILQTTNPEIIQNAKMSESGIEKFDTAKSIHHAYNPLIKEAITSLSKSNPLLQKHINQYQQYLKQEFPDIKYGESQISQTKLPSDSKAYGMYEKQKGIFTNPGDIILREDIIDDPLKSLGTIPHEIMHSYFPSYGYSERLKPLEPNENSDLREQLSDINNAHIITTPYNAGNKIDSKEPPGGETYVFNEIIKNILKKEK